VNGSGRGPAAADGASGMRRILRAGGRHLREDAHRADDREPGRWVEGSKGDRAAQPPTGE
jgi:hypothetical protein